MTDQISQPIALPRQDYMAIIIGLAMSPFNKWVTGVHVQHPPSENEVVYHFLENGGLTDIRRRYVFAIEQRGLAALELARSPFNRWVTGEKIGREPNDTELLKHFLENGGQEELDKLFATAT